MTPNSEVLVHHSNGKLCWHYLALHLNSDENYLGFTYDTIDSDAIVPLLNGPQDEAYEEAIEFCQEYAPKCFDGIGRPYVVLQGTDGGIWAVPENELDQMIVKEQQQ